MSVVFLSPVLFFGPAIVLDRSLHWSEFHSWTVRAVSKISPAPPENGTWPTCTHHGSNVASDNCKAFTASLTNDKIFHNRHKIVLRCTSLGFPTCLLKSSQPLPNPPKDWVRYGLHSKDVTGLHKPLTWTAKVGLWCLENASIFHRTCSENIGFFGVRSWHHITPRTSFVQFSCETVDDIERQSHNWAPQPCFSLVVTITWSNLDSPSRKAGNSVSCPLMVFVLICGFTKNWSCAATVRFLIAWSCCHRKGLIVKTTARTHFVCLLLRSLSWLRSILGSLASRRLKPRRNFESACFQKNHGQKTENFSFVAFIAIYAMYNTNWITDFVWIHILRNNNEYTA